MSARSGSGGRPCSRTGLKHEWVHVDALSGRRVLVAIRFAPSAPSEEVAAGC